MKRQQLLYATATGLSLVVTTLAVVAWGQMSDWHLRGLSVYRVFPLFGLLAFSWLWAQYIMLAAMHITTAPKDSLQRYFRYSGYGVLVMLLLHPSLLVGKLWQDGFGLPPGSYAHFVAPGMGWVVTVGVLSLLLFLAYEFHRWFSDRSWWRYIFYLSDLAMLGVLYHGLRLGDELQHGWYHIVWLVYGVLFVLALLYIHTRKPQKSEVLVI